MKLFKYLIILGVLLAAQFTPGASDTLDLVGGTASSWSFGWYGEAWNDSAQHWCGDTLYKDLTIDTSIKIDTVVLWIFAQVTDTIINGVDTQYVVRDTLIPDSSITMDTTYVDSSTFMTCIDQNFIADTGGFVEGKQYINYFYKFRNYWAQLPIVWTGWGGIDATSYKQLLITYKGILPTHQVKMNFFYGWMFDTTKNEKNLGDGVGTLVASPTEWATSIIAIPDSVDMEGITGITLSLANVPGSNATGTSDVGNIKIARLSLITGPDNPVRYKTAPRVAPKDRFTFTPKISGKVTVSIYSLKGELLHARSVGVEPGKTYSARRLAQQQSGLGAAQMRIVRIQGAGVFINEKIR
jgi:hypothetical protein